MRSDTVGICLLLFAAALVSWTAIFGPANPTTLKDWQPLMAAVIALAGGTLVYRAAILKIQEDRNKEQRDFERMRLGVLMRLNYAIYHLKQESENHRTLIEFALKEGSCPNFRAIALIEPAEIAEAWANLAILPTEISDCVDAIRRVIERINRSVDAHLPSQPDDDHVLANHFTQLLERLTWPCEAAVKELEKEIADPFETNLIDFISDVTSQRANVDR